jgi:hypothetical protein
MSTAGAAMRSFAVLAVGAVGAATGCGNSGVPPARGPLEARALAIAAEYTAWGRVDDELRWAPFLCRAPMPAVARMSESTDGQTHGQKLYSVFVKDRAQYPKGAAAGQVVVKESWSAEPVTGVQYPPLPSEPKGGGDNFYPYAKKGDTVYRAAARAGLFIMFKVDVPTSDTDEGWVYATVAPGGQVTGAGRMQSCMGCHVTATYGRLFGVPLSAAEE